MASNFPHFDVSGCTMGDLTEYKPDMNTWCYKILPLTYDDSLSYYEVLCKNIAMISKALSQDMPAMISTLNCMHTFLENMQDHFNELIDDYNGNITRIDGELDRIETKFDDAVTRLDAEDVRLDNKINSEAADIRAKYVKKAGDTMTGELNLEYPAQGISRYSTLTSYNLVFSVEQGDIINLKEPAGDYYAANKKYVDDKVAALGTVLEYKGTKPDIASLPASGNKAGDVWYVESEKSAYAWVIDTANPQGHWEEFGPPINLEPYLKKDGSVPMTGDLNMGSHSIKLLKGATLVGAINMNGNLINYLSDPVSTKDATNKEYVDIRALPAGGTTGQVLSKRNAGDYNTEWVDKGSVGLQPIAVTRDSAYITRQNSTFTTKILADPTAPPERPIQKDQIAVYSETNQTYAEDDVTGTLLVADPHSAMEAVNKRTLDGYLSKANINDEFERVTTVKGTNPGTENYRIVSTKTETIGENRIPAIEADKYISVDGIKMSSVNSTVNNWKIGFDQDTNNLSLPRISLSSGIQSNNSEAKISLNDPNRNENKPTIRISALTNTDLVQSYTGGVMHLAGDEIVSMFGNFTDRYLNSGCLITINKNQIKIGQQTGTAISPIYEELITITMTEDIQHTQEFNIRVPITLNANETTKRIIKGLSTEAINTGDNTTAVNKEYVDTNFIKVEGTPQEGSTIAYINGKWTVVDHTNWTPFN